MSSIYELFGSLLFYFQVFGDLPVVSLLLISGLILLWPESICVWFQFFYICWILFYDPVYDLLWFLFHGDMKRIYSFIGWSSINIISVLLTDDFVQFFYFFADFLSSSSINCWVGWWSSLAVIVVICVLARLPDGSDHAEVLGRNTFSYLPVSTSWKKSPWKGWWW